MDKNHDPVGRSISADGPVIAMETKTMTKTYVLDTNVLLHHAEALFAFKENDVVIPIAVIEEIDSQRKRQDDIGRNARMVSQTLDQLRKRGSLAKGTRLPQGGTFRIELNHQDGRLPGCFDPRKRDNQILAVVNHLTECQGSPVILVTRDLGLRIKAHVLGVCAEDFSTQEIGNQQPYTGVRKRHITHEEMEIFFS